MTAVSYPGVYVQEIPSSVKTVVGVPTSVAAFIGAAARGPVDEASTVNNFGDFERIFGGLQVQSPMSFAVRDFFLNGGGQAIIVRVANAASAPKIVLATQNDANTSTILEAASWWRPSTSTPRIPRATSSSISRFKSSIPRPSAPLRPRSF